MNIDKPEYRVDVCVLGVWSDTSVNTGQVPNLHRAEQYAEYWQRRGVQARIVKIKYSVVKEYIPEATSK